MTVSGNLFFKYVRFIRPAAVLLCAFGMIFMFASGCAALGRMWFAPGKKPVMETVAAKDLPAFADDLNFDALAAAVGGSIDYYRKLPASKTIDFGKEAYPASHLVRSLEHFLVFIEKKPAPAELSAFIERDYHVVAFTDRSKPVPVLFTGYYEPFLKGSRVRTETYKYPVYPRPDDLVTFDFSDFSAGCAEKSGVGRLMEGNLVSYYSRSQIEDTDVLASHLFPIAWVDD
ncbi:MAG: MltA domain-containing protein, partial [Desulfosalsimonadaceae bacterium]